MKSRSKFVKGMKKLPRPKCANKSCDALLSGDVIFCEACMKKMKTNKLDFTPREGVRYDYNFNTGITQAYFGLRTTDNTSET